MELHGLAEVRAALLQLRNVAGLKASATKALAHRLLEREYSGDPAAPKPEAEELIGLVKRTREHTAMLQTALQAALPPQDANAIVVRLPELELLSETVACIGELSGLLDRVGAGKPVKVTVQNFDSGSLNVEILGEIVGSLGQLEASAKAFAATVLFLWGLAERVRKWRKDAEEHALLMKRVREDHDETLRTKRLQNDDIEDRQILEKVVRRRIREALEEAGPFDNEQLSNLTDVAQKLSRLAEKGMMMMPASRADAELKLLGRAAELQLPDDAKTLLLPTSTDSDKS